MFNSTSWNIKGNSVMKMGGLVGEMEKKPVLHGVASQK
jgi:hypothetical protein